MIVLPDLLMICVKRNSAVAFFIALDAVIGAHNLLTLLFEYFSLRALVSCLEPMMSNGERKKNSQNKSCKRTSYMQAALCNKLLTIYATAKTG